MKLRNFFLFLFVLPLALFFDFILYAMLRTCPSCASFSQFVTSEGALSFPMVVELGNQINQLIGKINTRGK